MVKVSEINSPLVKELNGEYYLDDKVVQFIEKSNKFHDYLVDQYGTNNYRKILDYAKQLSSEFKMDVCYARNVVYKLKKDGKLVRSVDKNIYKLKV